MKHIKTFEAVINLSKEDMEILHKDGKVEKDGHTIEYSVNEGLSRKDIQSVIAKVYPQIVNDLGRSKRGTPKVEMHNNIYVRLSGDAEAQGEANPDAEYEWDKNEIYLYLPKMKNEEVVIKALLHEYTHATQDPKKREENRKLGYAKDPYEIEAYKAENNWKKYK